jgi:hypothetical protein
MTTKLTMLQVWTWHQAVRSAIVGFVGLPPGGWAETAQARLALDGALPWRAERDWEIDDLIAATLVVHAGRYRLRADPIEHIRTVQTRRAPRMLEWTDGHGDTHVSEAYTPDEQRALLRRRGGVT